MERSIYSRGDKASFKLKVGELYPSLYIEADNASARGQFFFLFLTRLEYLLLVIVAVLSMPWQTDRSLFAVVALMFVILFGVTLYRAFVSPERSWYNSRAVAESVKTLTWRFAMKSAPFECTLVENAPALKFAEELKSLLALNNSWLNTTDASDDSRAEITLEMLRIRELGFPDRKALYLKNRVDEQRLWYRKKARYNRRKFRSWIALILILYFSGISFAVARTVYPEASLWPIDPIVALAGAVLGWMQLKKFNELSASYALTAQEINLIHSRSLHLSTEAKFLEFVKDAEFAFSREHTQWIARQSS